MPDGIWLLTMREELHELAVEMEKSIMFADGLDEALIGYLDVEDDWLTSVYDTEKVLKILMKEGMEYEEAVEFHYFNIAGAYMGKGTPVFVERPVGFE